MGEIQILPPGLSAKATVSASASSIAPNQNVTLTANVVDASTGNPAPTGAVQFQLNGANVGNPANITNGVATLTTPVDGNLGSNNLVAFYEGDTNYTEVTSAPIPISVSAIGLTSAGAAANVGAAAIATVNVNVANNYTSLVNLTCTLPSNLAESACFVNPTSITGTGQVQLTVNTTPTHPGSSMPLGWSGWLAGGGSASLALILFFALPRRRWRYAAVGPLGVAIVFGFAGCSGGSGNTDAGTAKGTYSVVVTGTAGSGSSQYQTSVNVPITIQ